MSDVRARDAQTCRDRDTPVSSFAGSIDLLCCNRLEWETLEDREEMAWRVSILVITDGPAGSLARFTTPQGEPGSVRVPAFPRDRPPRDTNRAGETFAATFVSTLRLGRMAARIGGRRTGARPAGDDPFVGSGRTGA